MGSLGVPVFFVLSGFLIHYTFSRSSDQRVSMFWFRRWGRIYPAYFVALVTFALWEGTFYTARGRTDFWTHLFLVHSFHDRTLYGINGSFWSLAHESHFYLLYPLLLYFRNKVGMLPLLLGSLIVRLAIGGWFLIVPGQFATDPATIVMLPRLYFEWILGMYVADCFVRGKRALPWGWVAGALCLVYAYFAYRTAWWDLGVVPATAMATAIWIDQVVHKGSRDPSRLERVLIPLGAISYSVYLWHQPIVNHLSQHIMQSSPAIRTIGIAGAIALALFLSCLASIVVGAGAYQLFEAPATDWVRKWAKRFQPATVSVARDAVSARAGIRVDAANSERFAPPAGRNERQSDVARIDRGPTDRS